MNIPENEASATGAPTADPHLLTDLEKRDLAIETQLTPGIVLSGGKFYLRLADSVDYKFKLANDREFRTQFARTCPPNIAPKYYDDDALLIPTDEITQRLAVVAHAEEHRFSAQQRTFDRHTSTLTHGYKMGYKGRFGVVEAMQDLNAEDWLRELFGGTDQALQGAYEWIASTHQRHVDRLAAALVLIGPPACGKSLFATCLAKTWGVSTPPQLSNALERFNGGLRSCPIWHADESLPKGLTPDRFRDLVQRREHEIELKGLEKQVLHGAPRIIVTLNQIDDFAIGVASGPDALRAVGDRLAVYQASDRVSDAARAVVQDGEARIDAIVGHLLWVQQNHEPQQQRFLGGGFGQDSTGMLTRTAAQQYPEVFEAVRAYALDPCSWENGYADSNVRRGIRFPLITKQQVLYVNCVALAERIGGRVTARDVRAALGQFFCNEADRAVRVGSFRAKYWELDADTLQSGLGVDLAPVLLGDTGTRTPEAFAKVRALALESYDDQPLTAETERLINSLDPDDTEVLH